MDILNGKVHVKFSGFGLGYFKDVYSEPWKTYVCDHTHNILFLFWRIQIKNRNVVFVKSDGSLKEITS